MSKKSTKSVAVDSTGPYKPMHSLRAVSLEGKSEYIIASPAAVDSARQSKIAQLILAVETGEKVGAIQTNITHSTMFGNNEPRRLTLLVQPTAPAHAHNYPEGLFRDVIHENNGNLEDVDFREPIVTYRSAKGIQGALYAARNNLTTLMYGPDDNTSPPVPIQDHTCEPCYVRLIPEKIILKLPVGSTAKSRALQKLNDTIDSHQEKIAQARVVLGQLASEKTNEASDKIQELMTSVEQIVALKRESEEAITKSIQNMFFDVAENRRDNLFKLDSYQVSMAGGSAKWPVDKDTLNETQAADSANPFFSLLGFANLFSSEMVNIRIIYYADSDLGDLLQTLDDRKADLERFDVVTFTERVLEGRRQTIKTLQEALDKKDEKVAIKHHVLAVHFSIHANLLSDFFGGIHELRARLIQARHEVLANPVPRVQVERNQEEEEGASKEKKDEKGEDGEGWQPMTSDQATHMLKTAMAKQAEEEERTQEAIQNATGVAPQVDAVPSPESVVTDASSTNKE